MTEKELIRAEIERYIREEVCPGYSSIACCRDLLKFIDAMPKRNEDDALLLERAWLTLYYFEHNELAERLRDYAKRNDLVWMG